MEMPEPLADRVFGFLWRWLWRVVFWGVVAAVCLVALLYLASWAEEHPERWAMAVIAGVLGLCVHQLGEIKKHAGRQTNQNDRIIKALERLEPYPTKSLRDRMRDVDID